MTSAPGIVENTTKTAGANNSDKKLLENFSVLRQIAKNAERF